MAPHQSSLLRRETSPCVILTILQPIVYIPAAAISKIGVDAHRNKINFAIDCDGEEMSNYWNKLSLKSNIDVEMVKFIDKNMLFHAATTGAHFIIHTTLKTWDLAHNRVRL